MIEYFAANLWQMWALIAIICLIMELTNGDFFIMCFAIGGFLTAIVSLMPIGFYGQLVAFALFSVLCIFFVRPFALKYLHSRKRERLSNADALIGQNGRVSEPIAEGGYGRVAIDGDDWKAVSADGQGLEQGAKVKVVGRESVIITVERA
ncbi:MAG: NfeD family protein [Prevotellaceae bacterium]|nr:NfeD family protein [Prevotellaceae bacterium]